MGESSEALYNVTIEGEGLALTRQIDSATLARVLYSLLSGDEASVPFPRPADVAAPVMRATEAQPSRLSLREYLNKVGAQSYSEKITSIACYLESHETAASFSKDDIKARFRTAGEAPPANFHRDFSNAVGAGWVAEDVTSPGQFYVTHTGQAAVAGGFSTTGRSAPVRTTRRKRGGAHRY